MKPEKEVEMDKARETQVHSTAVVARGAILEEGVTVDAYAIIGPEVHIGRGTRIGAHAVVEGRTTLGCGNRIFHHASVGTEPQDQKYHGEESSLVIGDGNIVREFATIHTGTEQGGMVTRLGNRNLLMNFSHVAHDCRIGDGNVLANGAQVAGHAIIENYAVIGALSGIHQFVRIGESAFIGAGSMVSLDIPPYCNATGDRATLHGLNRVGLERRGFSAEVIGEIRRAYRILFQSRLPLEEALAQALAEAGPCPEVQSFLAFIRRSERGVCRPRRGRTGEE